MRVLVTGARGFLGRHVVPALRVRGHSVRALDRPRGGSSVTETAPEGVESVRADLCTATDLARLCASVQVVVHLALPMSGPEESKVESTLEGTRRLLDAMKEAGVSHLVLASSLSVYDWSAAGEVLDEESRLEAHPESRDAYTTAKLGQERLARDLCARHGIRLTALRPSVIWGTGREYPPTIGQRLGPLHVLIEGARQLPLIHVENAADAFAAVVDAAPKLDGTFDLVDHPEITVARFTRDYLNRSKRFGVPLSLGYRSSSAALRLLHRFTPSGLARRLPSFAAPARFAARYKPVRVDGSRFRRAFGWNPPLSYPQCLDATFGAASTK